MTHLKKGLGGHLLKNAVGHLVKECVGEPCTDCDGDDHPQPNVVATMDGMCDGDCANAADTYSLVDYSEGTYEGQSYCLWEWRQGDDYGIQVLYCIDDGHWHALAFGIEGNAWFGGADSFFPWMKDVTGLVHCNKVTHELVGAFTLDGTNVIFDCTGCTLEVTLGG